MKNFLALSLIFSSAALFAANVTNLPPIADKPWVTNTIRTSSALATNTPAAGYVLTSDGSTNYWKVNIASSTNVFNDSFASYGSVAHVWYDAPLHTVTLEHGQLSVILIIIIPRTFMLILILDVLL